MLKNVFTTFTAAFLLGYLASPVAHATHVTYENVFFTSLRFESAFNGKAVRSVKARASVMVKTPGSSPASAAFTQDVDLVRQGDHFFGKARLVGMSDNGGTNVEGIVVQYFVVFEDESTQIIDAGRVELVDDAAAVSASPAAWERRNALQKDFDELEDATRTEARTSRIGWIG